MDNSVFIINYDGSPLVVVTNTEFKLPSDILAWYAKEYDFDRRKLSWSSVQQVKMP